MRRKVPQYHQGYGIHALQSRPMCLDEREQGTEVL